MLLYGLLAQHKAQKRYQVVGEFLSYDPYGIMFRKGDAQLAELVRRAFHGLAEDGEIERQCKRWFLQRLPDAGQSLDLPMSPQLETPDPGDVGQARMAFPVGKLSFLRQRQSDAPVIGPSLACSKLRFRGRSCVRS